MKAIAFAIRSFGRELRSGEVIVLLTAVALAVGVLTAVGFLTDRIGKAVARQANEVLAADLRLRSQEPVPENWRDAALQYNLETAETQTFPSVVFADDLGARVTLVMGSRRTVRSVGLSFGYLASHSPWLHFGVGETETIDRIEVRWPDGSAEVFPGGSVDRSITLRRGSGEPADG